MRTKHNRNEKQGRTGAARRFAAAAIVLALVMATEPVRAESPWSTLSRWVSPTAQQPAAATAQAGRMAALNDESLGVTRGFKGDLPAVDYENVTAGRMPAAADFRPNLSALGLGQGGDPVRLGLESDEDASSLAANLFSNPEMLKLLGDKPRFVYDPAEKQDPMLVPWVRSAAIFSELSEQAEAMMKLGNVDAAVEVYGRILALQDPRFTSMVQARRRSSRRWGGNSRGRRWWSCQGGGWRTRPVCWSSRAGSFAWWARTC